MNPIPPDWRWGALASMVIALLTFCVVSVAALVPVLFWFAPGGDPHLFVSDSDRAWIVGVPLVVAGLAMLFVLVRLDAWTFGPPDARVGPAWRRWVVRLAPVAIVILSMTGYREARFQRAVRDARSSGIGMGGAAEGLSKTSRGRRALRAIVADRSAAPAGRLACAVVLHEQSGGAPPQLEPLLDELVTSHDPAAREAVASGMSRLEARLTVPRYAALLSDSEPAIVLATVRALSYDNGRPSEDPVLLDRLEALMSSDSSEVREPATMAYFKAVGNHLPSAQQRLRRLLTHAQLDIRVRAALALGYGSDMRGADVLLEWLRQSPGGMSPPADPTRFVAVMSFLSRTRDARVAPVLWTLEHCAALDPDRRRGAGHALDELFTKRESGEVRPLVPDQYDHALVLDRAPDRPAWREEYCPRSAGAQVRGVRD